MWSMFGSNFAVVKFLPHFSKTKSEIEFSFPHFPNPGKGVG